MLAFSMVLHTITYKIGTSFLQLITYKAHKESLFPRPLEEERLELLRNSRYYSPGYSESMGHTDVLTANLDIFYI